MRPRNRRARTNKNRNLFRPAIRVESDVRFKTIDGKRYELYTVHQYKEDAAKEAKLLRKMKGVNARVFPECRTAPKESGGMYHGKHGVYVYWG